MVVGVAASTQTQVTELQNDKKFGKKFHRANQGEEKSYNFTNLQKKLYRAKREKKVQRANRDEKRYNEQIGMKKGTTSKSGLKKRYNEQIDKKVTPRKSGEQSYNDQIDKKKSYLANQDINFHRN